MCYFIIEHEMNPLLTFVSLSFFVISLTLTTFNAQAVEEVTFSAGAPLDGFQAQIIIPVLIEAFKRNGVRFKAEHNPSLRSLQKSNSGAVDGELHRIYDFHKVSGGKYPNLIRIDSKILSVWLVAYSTKNITINNWQDLKKYNVVYYLGRKNVEKALGNIMPPSQLKTVNNDLQAFKVLAAKRTDIVISESINGQAIINSSAEFKDIKEIAKLNEATIYAYIHKKHEKLGIHVAETIKEMKKDRSFYKIVEKVLQSYQ
ncbi:hypothetical protein A9Q81_14865 [Gammaproteobacteria bacterium 42_54_T18]|nr:hypothetical protein A9Q81_14865 [Gammaproteobacteria bacterium 42_54_T18]